MLRLGIVFFTIGFVVQCSARSSIHGNLIERLKRSPYNWDPAPQLPPPKPYRPYLPPPPPPSSPQLRRPYWPPPPPPNWHHNHNEPGPFQQYADGQNESEEFSNESCEACKGKNSAVSNSQSVNGDAIAISISRSNGKT